MFSIEAILDKMKYGTETIENVASELGVNVDDVEFALAYSEAVAVDNGYCEKFESGIKSGFNELVVATGQPGDIYYDIPSISDDPWFVLIEWANGNKTPLPIVLGGDTFAKQNQLRNQFKNHAELIAAQVEALGFVTRTLDGSEKISPCLSDYIKMARGLNSHHLNLHLNRICAVEVACIGVSVR